MVRIISQGFSTPRSRHSSGEEMIDRFAAMKALSALSDDDRQSGKEDFTPKTLVIDCSTDTNDSFSGIDSEEECKSFKRDRENNNVHPYQEAAILKKERRRERNKVSAQNYRQRRRQQVSAAQKTLESLEVHNKNLLDKVRQLEAEKHIVEEYLKSCVRIPWCPFHQHADHSHHRCTPTIPEDGPTEPIIQPPNPNEQPCCSGLTNMQSPLDNCRPVDMSTDNANNNMPLCMSGAVTKAEESSAS